MIIVHTNNISFNLKQKLNDFILLSFENSRIDDYQYFIYCKKKEIIIGFVGLYYINNYLSINQLCVHPNFRKKGIATYIINFIKKIYKNSYLILYIDKNKKNTEYLLNYYKQRGFKEIDYLETLNLIYDKENEYLLINH